MIDWSEVAYLLFLIPMFVISRTWSWQEPYVISSTWFISWQERGEGGPAANSSAEEEFKPVNRVVKATSNVDENGGSAEAALSTRLVRVYEQLQQIDAYGEPSYCLQLCNHEWREIVRWKLELIKACQLSSICCQPSCDSKFSSSWLMLPSY
jgi:hypothetical protein